jgi:hypothetical protein
MDFASGGGWGQVMTGKVPEVMAVSYLLVELRIF